METEDGVLNHSSQWEVVEQLSELFPHVGISVLAQAFIIESIYLSDLSAFVISSENGDSVLEAALECNKEGDGLHRVVSSVHIVSHEQVVSLWRLSSNFE